MARKPRWRLETFERVLAALGQLGPLITGLASAAVAGHGMGWW
jgi:hypothetical protein